jgi:phosphate ABC transporter permease protein PstC
MSTNNSSTTEHSSKAESLMNMSDDNDPESIIEIGRKKISIQEILLLLAASASVIIVILVFIFTFLNAYQIIPEYGLFKFLFGDYWNPASGDYGILTMIVGTLLVVLIALVIAVPIGIACAIFLAEIAPDIVRNILKPVIELLASIPSIVYGFIALRSLVLFLQNVCNFKTGRTALTAGIVLAIMILPTIISIADDSIKSVPQAYREGSLALGATKWQTIRKVIIPASISGLVAAIILGVGRAVGETMAVYLIGGSSQNVHFNILRPIDTLTTVIVRAKGEAAEGSMTFHALFGCAVVLFLITFLINMIGNLVIKRFRKKLKGEA